LDKPTAPTLRRHWRDHGSGRIEGAVMTDLGWWFTRFSLLRNDLMHGRDPQPWMWKFDRVPHVDLAEWWLRQAIRETVARAGHPDIRMEPFDRNLARAWRDAFAKRDASG